MFYHILGVVSRTMEKKVAIHMTPHIVTVYAPLVVLTSSYLGLKLGHYVELTIFLSAQRPKTGIVTAISIDIR